MAQMVQVGEKPEVLREAAAEGWLKLQDRTLATIQAGEVKKGDPLQVARVAAIQAVKDTPRILPLCHPIPITGIDVEVTLRRDRVYARVDVTAVYKTGVEMEALTAVSAALLTVWDMVKYLEKDGDGQYPDTRIEEIRVVHKRKGNGG